MAKTEFRIRTVLVDGEAVVRVVGDLDAAAHRRFVDHFAVGVPARHPVAIDLTHVGFVDSSGLKMLLRAVESLRSEGRPARVSAASPQALKLFELSGVLEQLTGESPADEGTAT